MKLETSGFVTQSNETTVVCKSNCHKVKVNEIYRALKQALNVELA